MSPLLGNSSKCSEAELVGASYDHTQYNPYLKDKKRLRNKL